MKMLCCMWVYGGSPYSPSTPSVLTVYLMLVRCWAALRASSPLLIVRGGIVVFNYSKWQICKCFLLLNTLLLIKYEKILICCL